ncbi:MAG TPA: hypothetical protein ENG90_06850 [Gammaproteobacteria bacterium]|nr:hypothetical protein BMS3Abin11_01902 [bacterium BMS3Abin11]HDH16180.1 hypothetical protein [Gammaproteobacteria bacterium]HDZ78667.1 hypothetical protein [Gammaproteobacteria bacterium]
MLNETCWLIGLHIPASLLPASLMWLANIIMLALVILAIKNFSFTALLNNKPNQHVYFGAGIAVAASHLTAIALLSLGFCCGNRYRDVA